MFRLSRFSAAFCWNYGSELQLLVFRLWWEKLWLLCSLWHYVVPRWIFRTCALWWLWRKWLILVMQLSEQKKIEYSQNINHKFLKYWSGQTVTSVLESFSHSCRCCHWFVWTLLRCILKWKSVWWSSFVFRNHAECAASTIWGRTPVNCNLTHDPFYLQYILDHFIYNKKIKNKINVLVCTKSFYEVRRFQ